MYTKGLDLEKPQAAEKAERSRKFDMRVTRGKRVCKHKQEPEGNSSGA